MRSMVWARKWKIEMNLWSMSVRIGDKQKFYSLELRTSLTIILFSTDILVKNYNPTD